jgi:hypothetical protein
MNVKKSFRPAGVSIPEAMSRTKSTSNYVDRRDRLVVINEYDLARARIKVTEVGTDKKFEVYIDPAKASVASKSTGNDEKWRGNHIDGIMATQLPVGTRLALESATTEKIMTVGGEKIGILKANWIRHASDKSKAVIATVNSYNDRVTNVQDWSETAIDAQTADGEVALGKLFAEANQVAADHLSGKRVSGVGVEFRAMVPAGADRTGKMSYQVIDCTPPFDWVKAKPADGTNPEQPAHPLDGATIESELVGYMNYLYGSEATATSEAQEPRFSKEVLATLVVEVMTYRAYPAAPRSEKMELKDERNPLYYMANTRTKCSPDDADYIRGKNWAAPCIIDFTADKKPDTREGEWEDRNMVVSILANGYKGNLHKFVRASDGGRVTVIPGMDRPEVDQAQRSQQTDGLRSAPSAPASSNASAPPAQSSQPSLQAPSASLFGGQDEDPFANAFNGMPAEAPAPVSSAPAAQAPAAEESESKTPVSSPSQEAAAAPAKPEGKASAWSRRST